MLTLVRLENFKSWRDTGEVVFAPISGFFGANSSGKSSLLHSLLLMKQTAESSDRGAVFYFGGNRSLVELGDFESTVWSHDAQLHIKLSLAWHSTVEFEVAAAYGGGGLSGDEIIRLDVDVAARDVGGAVWPTVEKLSYTFPDGRQFRFVDLPDTTPSLIYPGGQRDRSDRDARRSSSPRTDKFYNFPHWALREEDLSDSNYDVWFELSYGFQNFMQNIHYLGPLRANPNRVYSRSGAQPIDMGLSGESVVDALIYAHERRVMVPARNREFYSEVQVDVYVADWLKRLGLVHDFRIEPVAQGRQLYEVRVRKTPSSPEVLLPDVGFGVSQILPVLTLCFYAPRGSTVIFDQPDIHLHPSVQAGLADVFIDAWQRRRVQVVFESHSEHLLRRLQRRIAENVISDDVVAMYFCSTNCDGASQIDHLQLDEFGNIANWPQDFFGDQFGEISKMTEAGLSRQIESD